ncbi:MAG: glycosyltransferase family 2 protein, partial [Bacteroidales bacterium]
MQKIVSIITPMYNAERFVAQTIESVIAQTYPYWEMLIVDDGSTDNCA